MYLSVIVPVYNVEEYVGPCLDSIYNGNADLSTFEVIAVNDGSTDGSGRVVEEYLKRYDNLTLISQDNQGLSAARMNGLARAQGDYVWFIDSDDWVEQNSIEKVFRLIHEQEGFSVYIMPIRKHDEETISYVDDYQRDVPEIADGWELIRKRFPTWFAQRYIIRRSLFDNPWLCFPLGHLHEDEYFGPVLLALAGRCYVCDTPLYNHRIRANSISNTISIRSSYDVVSLYAQLKAFANTLSKPYRDDLMDYCQRFMSYTYKINEHNWNTLPFRQFKRRKSPYLIAELIRNARFYTFKEWLAILFLLVCPTMFRRVFPFSTKK